ncbi:hypothetical protein JCM10213v2_002682 [Rhodosporidiobolus nylandii]
MGLSAKAARSKGKAGSAGKSVGGREPGAEGSGVRADEEGENWDELSETADAEDDGEVEVPGSRAAPKAKSTRRRSRRKETKAATSDTADEDDSDEDSEEDGEASEEGSGDGQSGSGSSGAAKSDKQTKKEKEKQAIRDAPYPNPNLETSDEEDDPQPIVERKIVSPTAVLPRKWECVQCRKSRSGGTRCQAPFCEDHKNPTCEYCVIGGKVGDCSFKERPPPPDKYRELPDNQPVVNYGTVVGTKEYKRHHVTIYRRSGQHSYSPSRPKNMSPIGRHFRPRWAQDALNARAAGTSATARPAPTGRSKRAASGETGREPRPKRKAATVAATKLSSSQGQSDTPGRGSSFSIEIPARPSKAGGKGGSSVGGQVSGADEGVLPAKENPFTWDDDDDEEEASPIKRGQFVWESDDDEGMPAALPSSATSVHQSGVFTDEPTFGEGSPATNPQNIYKVGGWEQGPTASASTLFGPLPSVAKSLLSEEGVEDLRKIRSLFVTTSTFLDDRAARSDVKDKGGRRKSDKRNKGKAVERDGDNKEELDERYLPIGTTLEKVEELMQFVIRVAHGALERAEARPVVPEDEGESTPPEYVPSGADSPADSSSPAPPADSSASAPPVGGRDTFAPAKRGG